MSALSRAAIELAEAALVFGGTKFADPEYRRRLELYEQAKAAYRMARAEALDPAISAREVVGNWEAGSIERASDTAGVPILLLHQVIGYLQAIGGRHGLSYAAALTAQLRGVGAE